MGGDMQPTRRGTIGPIICAAGLLAATMAGTPAAGQGAGAAARAEARPASVVRVRSVTGFGPRALMRTPQYTTSAPAGRMPPRTWAEVAALFDAEPEWLDELSVQFYALLHDRRRGEQADYTLCRGSVVCVDVAGGRGRQVAMYLRPAALERFGDVVAVAVEFLYQGQMVAQATDGRLAGGKTLPAEWWKNPRLAVRDGYLLSKSQTPFAFVNYDDHEVVK